MIVNIHLVSYIEPVIMIMSSFARHIYSGLAIARHEKIDTLAKDIIFVVATDTEPYPYTEYIRNTKKARIRNRIRIVE